MSMWSSVAVRVVLLAVASLAIGLVDGGSARAQGVFCPASAGGLGGVSLQAGTCTNGTTGAFSGAALGSQALSDLAQSTTQETTNAAESAISERRAAEAAACEPGLVRVDGICQPPAAARPAPREAPGPIAESAAKTAHPRKVPPRARHPGAPPPKEVVGGAQPTPGLPVVKGPPPVSYAPLPPGYRIGTWAHGFGDYERRSGTTTSSINCCSGAASNLTSGLPIPLVITSRSTTDTGGVLGGVDITGRSLFSAGDGLIVGIMGGYLTSDVRVKNSILSTNPSQLNNGFGSVKATLNGPSAGLYATYFNGGFSNEFLLKNDFLDLSETTNQLLAFTANANFNPITQPFVGAGKTHLNQLTLSDNVNYRFVLSPSYWIEPTAGIQYTSSSYNSGAAELGLKDGYLVRLQGGARLGYETFFGETRMLATLTGLVYDDVVVHGDFIQGGAFGLASNSLKDEGKLRGDGILAFNFYFGNGVSTFVQGEVRGGQGLFGAGGKAGLRVQW